MQMGSQSYDIYSKVFREPYSCRIRLTAAHWNFIDVAATRLVCPNFRKTILLQLIIDSFNLKIIIKLVCTKEEYHGVCQF